MQGESPAGDAFLVAGGGDKLVGQRHDRCYCALIAGFSTRLSLTASSARPVFCSTCGLTPGSQGLDKRLCVVGLVGAQVFEPFPGNCSSIATAASRSA
jgi:hypothetical protein